MAVQIVKDVLIAHISTNDEGPRLWEWRFPHLTDMDQYNEDRFDCTEARFPYTRIMYHEQIREQQFGKAVRRVEKNDEKEMRQFKPIIIDEYGMLISGFRILQIHKTAGRESVEVAQIIGLSISEKLEMMMADTDNFNQYNWTPKLPRLRHKNCPNYRMN